MGVDFEKCENCHECLNTQCFPNCFCCDNMIDDLCCDCVPVHNCVDIKHEDYLCDDCIQNETDDEIKRCGDNYHVKNITKIIKQVKKLRKTHFNKQGRMKKLQEKKERYLKDIENLNDEIEAINVEIGLLK